MENSAGVDDVDRISDLPDEILCRFLALLPTKLAFSTTVLSKRWAPLFKSLTSLHFDDASVGNDKEEFLRFRHFVDKITLSHQLITKFRLKCGIRHWIDDRFNLDGWIQTLKEHPLENLKISSMFKMIMLPPSFFSFSTLVVLKLKVLMVVGDISVDLPSLKTLHLKHFYFENHEILKKILSGCPILEDLHTQIFYAEQQNEGVTLSTTGFNTLSKLIRADISTFDVPFKTIHNVEFLAVWMKNRLPEPEINSYYKDFPVFRNLIHLELCFFNFHLLGEVVEMLQYCPKLQILSINKLAVNNDLFINWKCPNSVPECISSNLRSCAINYGGFVDEVQFATYILQNAPLLGVMKITITDALSPLPNRDALEALSSCPRISPTCELSIGFIQLFEEHEDHRY